MKNTLFLLFICLLLFQCKSGNKVSQTNQSSQDAAYDDVVTIATDYGNIVILLYDKTPRHKANFLKLAQKGFYNGTTFHRVIDGFMIQGGDPNTKDKIEGNEGQGGPGYTLPAEFDSTLSHVYGAVAAARLGDAVNPKRKSSGSQFYIVENKEGTHFLDQSYTVFGQVVKGMDVVEAIAKVKKDSRDKPLKPIPMEVSVERLKKAEIEEKYQIDFYE